MNDSDDLFSGKTHQIEAHSYYMMTELQSFQWTKKNIPGIILFIVFYLLLFLHLTIPLCVNRYARSPIINWVDIFCIIDSFMPEFIGNLGNIIIPFPILVELTYIIVTCLMLLLKSYKAFYISKIQTGLNYYFLTFFMIVCYNSCCRFIGEYFYTAPPGLLLFLSLINCFSVTIVVVFSVLSSSNPFTSIHPWVTRNAFEGCSLFIVIFYQIIMCSLPVMQFKAAKIVNAVFSLFAFIFFIRKPVYIKRWQNSVFLATNLYFATTCITLLFNEQNIGLIMLPIDLILSIVIFFFIMPNLPDRLMRGFKPLIAHMKNDKELCEKYITDMKAITRNRFALESSIQASIYFDNPILPTLFKEYGKFMVSLPNIIFASIVQSYIRTQNNKLPRQPKKLMLYLRKEIESLEKEFWLTAWLSDIPGLPRIASKIGNLKKTYNSNYDMFYHTFNEPSEFLPQKYNEDKSNLIPSLRPFDILFYFLLAFYTVLNVLIYVLQLKESRNTISYMEIQDFVHDFDYFLIEIPQNGFNSKYYNNIKQSYEKIVRDSKSIKTLNSFLNNKQENSPSLSESFQQFFEAFDSDSSTIDFDSIINCVTSLTPLLTNYSSYHTFQNFDINNSDLQILLYIELAGILLYIIIVAIFFYLLIRRIRTSFNRFRKVPKETFEQLGNFQPRYDIKSSIPFKQAGFTFLAFPSTIVLIFCQLIVLFWMFTNTELNREYLISNSNKQITNITYMSNAELIVLYVANDATQYYGHGNQNLYNYLQKADEFLAKISTTKEGQIIYKIIPQSFYNILGEALYNSYDVQNPANFYNFVTQALGNITESTSDYLYVTTYATAHFLVVIFAQFFIFVVIALFVFADRGTMILEYEEGLHLLHKAIEYGSSLVQTETSSTDSFNDIFISQDEYSLDKSNLVLFVLNEEEKLIFLTNGASQYLKIHQDDNLNTSRTLDIESLATFQKTIHQFNKITTNETATIQSKIEGKTFILSPFYKFDDQKMQLDHVLVLLTSDQKLQEQALKEESYNLYSYYRPSWLQDVELPISYQTGKKSSAIIVIMMKGFGEFVEKNPISIVTQFRKKITAEVTHVLEDFPDFHRIFENGSFIYLSLSAQTKISIWSFHISAAELSKVIVASINKIIQSYEAEITPFVLIYKCFTPTLILGDGNLTLMSFDTDCIYKASEMLIHCQESAINFTLEKKGANRANQILAQTIAVNQYKTIRGETFDLYAVLA